MTKNDWYDAGDQIKKLVQDAVDSGDFFSDRKYHYECGK